MRDQLGRYYTENLFSNLLISQLTSNQPFTVLDMGYGSGSLTQAAIEKWTNADFYAVEIKHTVYVNNPQNSTKIQFFEGNVLSGNIREILGCQYGSFDVAICNPPYKKLEKSDKHISILKKADLINSVKLKYYTSDLIFLAYNLLFLRDGGEVGIILPDGLLTSHEFKFFRMDIVKNYTIKTIVQLPDKIFFKTEARTHVLVLIKNRPINNTVNIYLAGKNGDKIDKISVQQSELISRMDFHYQKWKQVNPISYVSLFDLNVSIQRGNYTKVELDTLGINYFHTTHFPKNNESRLTLEKTNYLLANKIIIAEKGDILVARVGKRCIGKVCLLQEGSVVISDCVYRVRTQPEYTEIVLDALTSDYGRSWFSVFAHGVCSQVISKVDFLEFPIIAKN